MTERLSFDQRLGDLLDAGKIEQGDVDAVQEFRAFLADPEVPAPGQPIPVPVLRRYQEFLGLTDEDIAAVELRRRGGSR